TSAKGASTLTGVSHEKTVLSKVLIIFGFLVIVILGIVFLPDIIKGKEALLDVEASPNKLIYYQGEELGFDVKITNMGSTKDPFDTNLIYRLLDEDENTVLSKEETIAVSTTMSHYKTLELPLNIRPGSYTLKIFANYEQKVATASFSFNVEEKTTVVESCHDNVKNQNEIAPDCGGVCTSINGAYWYDGACHKEPKPGPPPKETCNDGIKNQDEVGPDCGGVCGGYWYDDSCHLSPKPKPSDEPSVAEKIMQASSLAKTNPEQAKNICLSLENTNDKDRCLKTIASISMKKEYCDLIVNVNERDECYIPFFMQNDFSVCEKITDPQSRAACEQMRDIYRVLQELNQTNQTNPT
ncbi:hypothetical protein KY341_06225, partial [Candidatus Woesearchaeota archaeon]|nr:hypothetical protein [Candidatus Woesearchaeota archaeon]